MKTNINTPNALAGKIANGVSNNSTKADKISRNNTNIYASRQAADNSYGWRDQGGDQLVKRTSKPSPFPANPNVGGEPL